MNNFLLILEIIGTIAFSIAASISGIKKKVDILGVIIVAITTSLVGGMIRDIILNKELVVFAKPLYLAISTSTAIITFFIFKFNHRVINLFENAKFKSLLNILDAIGLGVFVVVGINVCMNYSNNALLIIFSGIITAVGGGMVKDIFLNEIPAIFRKHIYAVAAIIGSIVYFLFLKIELEIIGSLTTIILVTLIRFCSSKYELSLPKIKLD